MRKGQAGIEFLMTYGWAILVVLVAIGALAYFGVLSPAKFLPSSCTITPEIGCDDFKADLSDNTIQLLLRNGKGESLTAVTVAVAGCTNSAEASGDDAWDDGTVLGGTDGITLTNCGLTGTSAKKDITITYTASTGVIHTATGSLTVKIKA